METKEARIIEAAWQLFYRHGYKKVSMLDIAEAAQMSRPSLYASFGNKQAIFSALVNRQTDRNELELAARLTSVNQLQAQIECVFDVWIVEPVASVIDSENGMDLLANCGAYAPDALAHTYRRFEAHLAQILKPAIVDEQTLSAEEIAQILRLATTGIKASAEALPTLRRMVNGLIAMAIATVKPR